MSYINEIASNIVTLEKAIIKQDIEKAWKKHPVGTVITRKDGRKYKKVSETGNMDQDWKLVSKDKIGMAKDESKQNSEAKQPETVNNKPSKENLQESAKNTSETALNNAIKQSPDPEVRQAAHEELQRRESEEKSKEENKKENNKHVEKFRTLSDEQIKFYLDAPYPEVKEAAKMVADERVS